MFEYTHRIRYSETDLTGRLSMQGLLRLFQDMNYFGAEDAGRGIAYQSAHGAAWYLLSWDVHMETPPALNETVVFRSSFYQQSGALAKKYMTLTTRDGALCAWALTRWAFVDIASGEITPFPDGYWEGEVTGVLPAGIHPTPRIPTLKGRQEAPLIVKNDLIDENGHVNNVRFSELALSTVGKDVGATLLQAEFLRQTHLGDILYPTVAEIDGKTVIRFTDHDGEVYASFATM